MPNAGVTASTTSVDATGEFPFAPEDYLLHLLASLATFRDAALDQALKPLDLNVSRFRVLSALIRCGDCTMSELSSFIAVDRTTLTRVADQLVAGELVERVADDKDRRRVLLSLTRAGRKRYREGAEVFRARNAELAAGVPPDEMRGLARTLVTLLGNAATSEATRISLIEYRRPA
jgi:DNA-binding MarR family transcriptional regulator